jgi:hypothetical protein
LKFLACLASSIPSVLIADDCNDTNRTIVDRPGKQAGSEIVEQCGLTSFTFSYTVSAEGTVAIVSAGAEGSITATIAGPSSCVQEYVWLGADVHECQGTLEGYHCDPNAEDVRVKLFKADPACPTIPITPESILDAFKSVLQTGAVALTVTCNRPVDASDELDPSGRKRKTARLTKCRTNETESGDLPEGAVGGYPVYVGQPDGFDSTAFVPSSPGPGTWGFTGFEQLLSHLEVQPSSLDALPEVARQALASQGILGWADDLGCRATTAAYLSRPDGSFDEYIHVVDHVASLRPDGDFSVIVTEAVDVGEARDIVFSESWARVAGDLFFASGSESLGLVYPRSTGASSLAQTSHLPHIIELADWVDGRCGLRWGPAFEHEMVEIEDGVWRVTQRVKWRYDDGVGSSAWISAILGAELDITIDTSGASPRIVRSEWRGTDGARVLRTFEAYRQAAPGVWRPSVVTKTRLGPDGFTSEAKTLQFDLRRPADAEPGLLPMPRPLLGRWLVVAD